MEGVVVSARRDGANVAVSVVSDARGRYEFPATHLTPGQYTVTVRAVGYDLVGPGSVDLAKGKPATRDLVLRKTSDLSAQLSSAEWAMSMPADSQAVKDRVMYQGAGCHYCHSLRRVARSKYTAEQFIAVINRMQQYYPDGTAAPDERRGAAPVNSAAQTAAAQKSPHYRDPSRGVWAITKADMAAFFAAVNLSGGRTSWPYELKTLPRPTGQATRVIVTEWDLPRRQSVPHDLDVDSRGTVWYTDESRGFVGKLEPGTSAFTEYPMPAVHDGDLQGTRDVQVDKDDNVWFVRRVAGGKTTLTKFDPKTQALTSVEGAGSQFLALGPGGKIWAGLARVDPKTAKIEATYDWKQATNLPPGPHGPYSDHAAIDSKGNPYVNDYVGGGMFRIDATTGAVKHWALPFAGAGPRRGRMDAQDRFWFGEYSGDKIGMFDTRTEQFREWPAPHKYTNPYTASVPDRNGFVYSPSHMSERVLRLDPRTGQIIEYQMPAQFDAKKIAFDPTSTRATLWMANERTARIIRLEPLD